jgi:hypothetical protein
MGRDETVRGEEVGGFSGQEETLEVISPGGCERPALSRNYLPEGLRWACIFLALGLFVGFVNECYRMSYIQRATIVIEGDRQFYAQEDVTKYTIAVKAMGYATYILICAAALAALRSGCPRFLPVTYMYFYAGMWLCSIYLVLGLTTHPIQVFNRCARLFSWVAPGSLISMGLFFLSANPYAWPVVRKILYRFTVFVCVAWFFFALQMENGSRVQAYRWVFSPGLALELLALLSVVAWRKPGVKWYYQVARYVPMGLLGVTAIFLQARLVVVIFLTLVVVYAIVQRRSIGIGKEKKDEGLSFNAVLLLAVVFFAVFGYIAISDDSIVGRSAEGLWDRKFVDTRTNQIKPFFEKLTPSIALFGAGYPCEGEYSSTGSKGIDCGYLNVLYVAGLPMLTLFVLMLVSPVLRCLRLPLSREDSVVVVASFAYVLRLMSSTLPLLSVEFVLALLLLGRTAFILHAAREEEAQQLESVRQQYLARARVQEELP